MKPDSSRQGFTLIELLIVTVVIATLMGIVFRLAGTGGETRRRAVTIDRLQRIENALSGYYAAYGSYPPVPLQGRSRSIYKKVDGNYLQEKGSSETGEKLSGGDPGSVWNKMKEQVLAACKSQPVAAYFPFNIDNNETREMVQLVSKLRSQRSGGDTRSFNVIQNVGGFDLDNEDWRECSLFQFGLMSFLMPRYLFMLEGDSKMYDNVSKKTRRRCGQWAANNQLPCRMDDGQQFDSWKDVQKAIRAGEFYRSGGGGELGSMISNLTSQSVCARWMPNFEGIVTGGRAFYGINTEDTDRPYMQSEILEIHSPRGYNKSGTAYVLDGMTIHDGWGNEFYYYSEPPYQSYRLWSAGPDGRTFPPWYDRSQLDSGAQNVVQVWTKDDISSLNN